MSTPSPRLCLTVSAAALAAALISHAGPLDPPAGPVAPTYKTLTEVEPRTAITLANTPGDADSLFKITKPGSYYLTGNIEGVIGKHGIEIAADGVTIDLNGFDLVGLREMGAFDGVTASVANLVNIAVFNGSVRNWGDEGVDLSTFPTSNCRVERVVAFSNAGDGIRVGPASAVTNCSVSQNGFVGIRGSTACKFSGNLSYSNSGNGFASSADCTYINCSASTNGGTGISTSAGSTLTNCSASHNASKGILTANSCTISDCSGYSNGSDGFDVGNYNTVTNCTAMSNGGVGFEVSSSCTITGCTGSSNTLSGFRALSVTAATSIINCVADSNDADGIQCGGFCVIRGNNCSSNGGGASGDGAGIHAVNSDNVIEGNRCGSADRGIDVDSSGNIVIKNTCTGNTINWTIAIGNAVAPIVNASTNGAAISGSTYAGSLGSTDPNANFSY